MSDWPLFQLIENLEGFDFAAFLLSAIVAFFSVGFVSGLYIGTPGNGPLLEFFLRNAWRLCRTLLARLVASALWRI